MSHTPPPAACWTTSSTSSRWPDLSALLSACPRLKILATSRAALHLRGEREYPVPPLALPEAGPLQHADDVSAYAAVELFLERAADVRPDFTLRDEDAPLVVEICRRLDGLPLAIELAAARVKLLTPRSMLPRLERRLSLLVGGAHDAPERQQTLRATISWSYDLLDEHERRVFDRMAVFAGSCTLEAIEAICDHDTECRMPVCWTSSASLVDKSLVRQIDGPDGTSRFTMLETVREFATERLAASGEEQTVRRRHAEYYLAFAELARGHLRGPEARTWLDGLEAEHDNLRAALRGAHRRSRAQESMPTRPDGVSGIELASRIAQACAWFWMLRGHLRQGLEYVERLLADAPKGTPASARALLVASGLLHYAGDGAGALRRGEEGLAAWRSLGDSSQIALGLARVGEAYGQLRQADQATARWRSVAALSGDARHKRTWSSRSSSCWRR